MASQRLFGLALKSLATKQVDFQNDTVKAMLLTSGYSPNYDTHQFKSDLTNELSTVATTLSSSVSIGATTISVAASIPAGTKVSIGSSGTVDIRTVTAVTGTGPFTLTLDAALSFAQSSGAAVQASPGYTASGVALSSKTVTYTAANSWGTARANSTAYNAGDIVRPAAGNGFLYRATVGGTSGGSVPTYPTVVGQTVVDGGVTWVNVGTGVLVLDSADPSWPSSSLIARYMAVVDATPATDATRPLLTLVDFGSDQQSTSGTFTVQLAATGIAVLAAG